MSTQDLQKQARRSSATQRRDAAVDGLCQVSQLRAGETLGLGQKDFTAVGRGRDQAGFQSTRHCLQNHEIAKAIQKVDGKATWFMAGFNDVVDDHEQGCLVLLGKRLNGLIQQT